MTEEIAAIDTSPIEALLAIKTKQDQLQQLVERAEASRSKVSEAVFRRVAQDYETRRLALEAEAKPLRRKARQEHARLEPLHERLRRQVEEAKLDKEELEFRHAVGELSDEEFTQRGKTAGELLDTRKKDFAEADDLAQRFVAVMGAAEAEPEPAPRAAEAAPPAERPRAAAAPAAASSEPATRGGDQTAALPKGTARPLAPPTATGATLASQARPADDGAEATAWISPEAMARPAAGAGGEEEHAGAGTMVMRFARLVAPDGEPPAEYQLGLRTTIGRTPDNDITIANALVSRHHAVISFSANEYAISDLKSGNGTFVNDNRIEQHVLAEGDRIKIGPMLFVFRAADE